MMIWRGKYSGPILGYSWTPPHAVCMYRLVHRTRTSVMRRRIFRGACRGGAAPRGNIFSTMKFRTMSILYDRSGAVVMHLYRTACINGNFRQNRPHFSTGVYAHTPHKKRHLCTEDPTKMVFFLGPNYLSTIFCLISAYIGAHEAKTVIRDDIVPDNMACGAYWAVLTGGNFARWTLYSAYNRV